MAKFDKIKEQAKILKNEFEVRKLRGINEFNIFSVLRKENDEVGLHSKFIYSLLNPLEKHYQKDLFLKLFLKAVGLENFINLHDVKVYREYENIDIYITDGENHIILENKIYANDREKQIQGYINKIEANSNNRFVLYLSLDRENPSESSLGEYKLNDEKNQILDENGIFIAKFKNIHYDTEIKNWLEMCLNEVGNITNLSLYIRDYSMVIDKIYGNYKELVMETKALWNRENYKILKAIFENYKKDKDIIFIDFLNKLKDIFEKEYKDFAFDILKKSNNKECLEITENSKKDFSYKFEFTYNDFIELCYGVYNKNNKFNKETLEELAKKYKLKKGFSEDKWGWKCFKEYNYNFFDFLFEFGNLDEAVNEFYIKYLKRDFDETFKELLLKYNKNPDKYSEKVS
ncbi:PDDEXK-like family protein [Campylobacter sp. CS_NA1]|uniref:PDDEXK-like family protein n=1 Tax=Campylobacter sp. CS_NA1 TaxID=2984139 RepID=UPI0022E9FAE1|nr:PD-(D/E)XK nuclease family protein [Campylobacter sp. CS_NA1]MDA3081001.1 PD-(D/E)XK nuclease family protein [Campylobacter sp. CS_NA1]